MARHLQITMTTALVVLAGSFSAGARSSMPADDRWNPQHIDVLPSEVRNAIVPYARICGGPLAAGHSFVRYFQNGTVKLIGLHFENYISRGGGPYRLFTSAYVPELDLTQIKIGQ
jgi:hypothetical protein